MAEPPPCPPNPAPRRVVELVVNLDDATGEQVGDTIDRLMRVGALDAWATPITMKKGRPAVMLSVLVNQTERDAFARLILELTGSFGVRYRAWDRLVLDRAWHEAPTRLGPVKLKAGSLAGELVTVKPEHATVAALAEQAGVTLAEAHRAAQAAADRFVADHRDPRPSSQGGGGE